MFRLNHPHRIYSIDFWEGDALIDIYGDTYCFTLGGEDYRDASFLTAIKSVEKDHPDTFAGALFFRIQVG